MHFFLYCYFFVIKKDIDAFNILFKIRRDNFAFISLKHSVIREHLSRELKFKKFLIFSYKLMNLMEMVA